MKRTIAIVALAAAMASFGGQAIAQEMDLMQFADADQDGKVTPTEYASFSEQGWGFFSQGAEKVKVSELDAMAKGAFVGITPDAEGYVSKAAYLAVVPDRFKAADKNGDGTLDSKELNGSMMPPS